MNVQAAAEKLEKLLDEDQNKSDWMPIEVFNAINRLLLEMQAEGMYKPTE